MDRGGSTPQAASRKRRHGQEGTNETSQKLDEMHHVSTYTSTCSGMRRRLALGCRGRGAGVRVPGPRFLPRQITLFEQHVLTGCRDPRVLVLVEDNLGLGR